MGVCIHKQIKLRIGKPELYVQLPARAKGINGIFCNYRGPLLRHINAETLLQSSGVPYVSLRNGFYAESALYQLSGVKQTGKISLPEDSPVSWTARADLAEAAVATLTEAGLFDEISPPLTSSHTLDFADIAKLASEILGRNIVRETVSDQEYRTALISHGVPETMAEGLGSLYKAGRAREFAVVDPTLERLLRRKPAAMKDVLNDFLSKPETKSW